MIFSGEEQHQLLTHKMREEKFRKAVAKSSTGNLAALQDAVNQSGTTIIAMLIMDFAPFQTISRALDQHRLGCHTIAARTRSDLCAV